MIEVLEPSDLKVGDLLCERNGIGLLTILGVGQEYIIVEGQRPDSYGEFVFSKKDLMDYRRTKITGN